MAKEIIFDTDKMAIGVDKLANAVKITMGPKGRTVVIEKSYGAPVATKDGVTVAKAVSLKDPGENIGARMVQEVAKKAGDDAGDGTTTATVLAQKIIREGRRVIAAGMNPMDVKRGIDIATSAVSLKKSCTTSLTMKWRCWRKITSRQRRKHTRN